MKKLLSLALILSLLLAPAIPCLAEGATKSLRILATSDLHGKFMPWDYALNAASPSGSMAQLSTAIARYRTNDTLLVDAGDTIQDNAAEIFLGNGEVHPMIQAINALRYDVWTVGNHEFNYGMDVTKQTVADVQAKVLAGNVYDETGTLLADGYIIRDVGGVRVAVLGMVTPNIVRWDAANLEKCTVTDPLEETRKIIDAIEGRYDVLLGVYHMGIESEYGVPNSGVTDILNACPEFDVMVSSHEHALIPSLDINGALVVQNKNMAQTMSVIDLTLEKAEDGWKVAEKRAESVDVGAYEPDPALMALLAPCDQFARADAQVVVARLEGGPLAPANEIDCIPTAQIQDTALIDLINLTQLHYTGAAVSSTVLSVIDANLFPGDIRKCDTALVYKYNNTLYTLQMTGAQLRTYMEWSASYYNTFRPGDLTISFDPGIRSYNYDMFEGVLYEINISKAPGSRIENLRWPDGTPVRDEDEFLIVVNNYRATSHLLAPGTVYEADDLPTLVEKDVCGEIGGIREMIREYIVHSKGGVLLPECNDNWRLVGYEWEDALHQRAVELLREGKLTIPTSEDGRTPNARSITVNDLAPFLTANSD